MSKTKAWITLTVFAAFFLWGLMAGIEKYGAVQVAKDIGSFLLIFVLVLAGLFALGLAALSISDRVKWLYRRWFRPDPWLKPFTVSQSKEGKLYTALKSRLELIERDDQRRSETYIDRETGQRWQTHMSNKDSVAGLNFGPGQTTPGLMRRTDRQ